MNIKDSSIIPDYPSKVWIVGSIIKDKNLHLPIDVIIRSFEDNDYFAVFCIPVYTRDETVCKKMVEIEALLKSKENNESSPYSNQLDLDIARQLAKKIISGIDPQDFNSKIESAISVANLSMTPSSIKTRSAVIFPDNEELDVMYLD